jgi:hypothetical protein
LSQRRKNQFCHAHNEKEMKKKLLILITGKCNYINSKKILISFVCFHMTNFENLKNTQIATGSDKIIKLFVHTSASKKSRYDVQQRELRMG